MKKNEYDPFIITKKAVFMQRIADLVRLNHGRYVYGQIPLDKAGYFAAKMDLYYGCFANKVQAHRVRAKGYATTRLLFYHPKEEAQLHWILLSTPGVWESPYSGNEKWMDPAVNRVALTGYEMVRHIRPGNADPSWTWRYNATRQDEIRDAIIMAIRRHNNQDLISLIDVVWRSPAFAGVREQIKKFAALIKAEWTRTGSGSMPELPAGLGYVRRLPDKGMLLSKLKRDLKNGN